MVAGGIDLGRVEGLRTEYGDDCILLIGSSLYTSSPDVESNARRMLRLVTGTG